eukprot:7864499-Pyramimonas_sp.AAC.2
MHNRNRSEGDGRPSTMFASDYSTGSSAPSTSGTWENGPLSQTSGNDSYGYFSVDAERVNDFYLTAPPPEMVSTPPEEGADFNSPGVGSYLNMVIKGPFSGTWENGPLDQTRGDDSYGHISVDAERVNGIYLTAPPAPTEEGAKFDSLGMSSYLNLTHICMYDLRGSKVWNGQSDDNYGSSVVIRHSHLGREYCFQ